MGTGHILKHFEKYMNIEPLCCAPELTTQNSIECKLSLKNKIKRLVRVT